MPVLTADHFIEAEADFRDLLTAAERVAGDGFLVTLGIKPTYPSTGYGYILRGDFLGDYAGKPAYRVQKFVEKPAEDTARQYLASEKYAWNSGMFIWQAGRIMDEFARQMPELHSGLNLISDAWGTPQQDKIVNDIWSGLKSETIDYGIMEHARDVAVLPAADLGWNDVGSWESLFDVLPADENGNIILQAHHIGLGTEKSLIFGNGSDRLVVTIGLKNMVIIDTGDTLLICEKGQAQKVRQVVSILRSEGRSEYL
jgi:mannose-1-phosphate guanylyltransferase